jgi:hypothetical protein
MPHDPDGMDDLSATSAADCKVTIFSRDITVILYLLAYSNRYCTYSLAYANRLLTYLLTYLRLQGIAVVQGARACQERR